MPSLRFIDVEELMSVMVMLGNPRSEDEVSGPIRARYFQDWPITGEDHDPGGGQNGDGLIDREEFFSMLQKNKEPEDV